MKDIESYLSKRFPLCNTPERIDTLRDEDVLYLGEVLLYWEGMSSPLIRLYSNSDWDITIRSYCTGKYAPVKRRIYIRHRISKQMGCGEFPTIQVGSVQVIKLDYFIQEHNGKRCKAPKTILAHADADAFEYVPRVLDGEERAEFVAESKPTPQTTPTIKFKGVTLQESDIGELLKLITQLQHAKQLEIAYAMQYPDNDLATQREKLIAESKNVIRLKVA